MAQALLIVMRRGSLRTAEEIAGHKYETIGEWLRRASEHADALSHLFLPLNLTHLDTFALLDLAGPTGIADQIGIIPLSPYYFARLERLEYEISKSRYRMQLQQSHHLSGPEGTMIGQLYQRHWHTLFTAIRQSISSREDAEDILLEVFLAAIENSALPGMSEMHQEAWLRRVAYNKCMDFHRRTTRRPKFSLEGYAAVLYDNEDLAPERVALRQEEVVQLRENLAILSADQREILRLRFADELPCAQIAARMHKSEGAVRAALTRALNHLRGMYTKRRKENSHD